MEFKSLYMLTDDIKSTVQEVKEMGDFLIKLGKEWKKVRKDYYKTMPEQLLRMLDELTDALVCEEGDCRELVHEGWDFCEQHGLQISDEDWAMRQKK